MLVVLAVAVAAGYYTYKGISGGEDAPTCRGTFTAACRMQAHDDRSPRGQALPGGLPANSRRATRPEGVTCGWLLFGRRISKRSKLPAASVTRTSVRSHRAVRGVPSENPFHCIGRSIDHRLDLSRRGGS